MDSMGDALDAAGGAVPELAAVVQWLSAHLGLLALVLAVALVAIMLLAEVLLPEQRSASSEPPATS